MVADCMLILLLCVACRSGEVVEMFSPAAASLDAQHIAEAAKEGDGKTKDGKGDGDRGVSGTLFGSSDFRANKVGDGVAAALGCDLLDHDGCVCCLFGRWGRVKKKERKARSKRKREEKKAVGSTKHTRTKGHVFYVTGGGGGIMFCKGFFYSFFMYS